jgi:predicted secreted Zn-dependent protease
MLRFFCCAWVIASACVWALPAHAVLEITDRVEYYDIQGSTALELRYDMNAKGPQAASGDRFDAYTRWLANWRWRYRDSGSGCAIASVRTTVTVRMTLPRWQNEHSADLATQQEWARFLAALERHEDGHRGHGVAAGDEIDRRVASLPPAATCAALGAIADELGKRIVQKYIQLDADYDRDTGHGATQGARYP